MNQVKLVIENCHGIGELTVDFDFTNSNVIALYGSNGTMKSSLAKVLSEYADPELDPKTSPTLYPGRNRNFAATVDGSDLDPASICVVHPLIKRHGNNRPPEFLVNKKLRDEYTAIAEKRAKKRDELLGRVKTSGKIGGGDHIHTELTAVYGEGNDDVLLRQILDHLKSFSTSLPTDLVYRDVFNTDMDALLKKNGVEENIKKYIELHRELSLDERYLRDGFTVYELEEVGKSLKKHKYFKAKHEIKFKHPDDESKDRKIVSDTDYDKFVKELMHEVGGEAAEKILKELSPSFSTAKHRAMRELVSEKREVLLRFDDLPSLRKELLLKAFSDNFDDLTKFIKLLDETDARLKEIREIAIKEKDDWQTVREIFRKRFTVPFSMDIPNSGLAVCGVEPAKPLFTYTDDWKKESIPIDHDILTNHLSQGEQRALFLLDVIFEIEERKRDNRPTLFVFDDVAESFDYKNKFAIIEYLVDISSNPNFRLVLLTHNYDFYRTVKFRFPEPRPVSLMAVRNDGVITIGDDPLEEDAFKSWRDHLHQCNYKLLAAVPFVRNLAMYGGKSNENNALTEYLHMKPGTSTKTIKNLEDDIKAVLTNRPAVALANGNELYLDRLFNLVNDIVNGTPCDQLEHKVVLSIAVRLKAESFLISKITVPQTLQDIYDGKKRPQTRALHKACESDLSASETQTIDKVHMMTSSNIHINSFMFEPIIDTSPDYLKTLYTEVLALTA